MNLTAQPLINDDSPLSPWWIRSIIFVMILGFSGLILVTTLSYRNAPPIPQVVLDEHGNTLFSGEDIGNGQSVFLKYGLMANGSIWGHGAYLGPDYAAAALHRIGNITANTLAQQQYQQPAAKLSHSQQASVYAETAVTLKN
ncbi:MAG: hypothetical protein WBP13_02870 [Methylophilaceae bacterium]